VSLSRLNGEMRSDGGRNWNWWSEKMFLTFDVELDYVGEWMELHVSVRESVNAEKHNEMDRDGWGEDLHEGISQAHHTNNEDVHTKRETNNPHVKSDESLIFYHYHVSV
jgi:hypothetical protein